MRSLRRAAGDAQRCPSRPPQAAIEQPEAALPPREGSAPPPASCRLTIGSGSPETTHDYAVVLQVLVPVAVFPEPAIPGVSPLSWQLPPALLSCSDPPPTLFWTSMLPWTVFPRPFWACPTATAPALSWICKLPPMVS